MTISHGRTLETWSLEEDGSLSDTLHIEDLVVL